MCVHQILNVTASCQYNGWSPFSSTSSRRVDTAWKSRRRSEIATARVFLMSFVMVCIAARLSGYEAGDAVSASGSHGMFWFS